MMLLVAIVTGAKAAPEAIFSAQVAATSNQSWTGTSDGVTTELTSAQATVTGGKMYVVTYQTSSKNLISAQSSVYYFTETNNNTYFKVELNTALQAGDVIAADVLTNGAGSSNARGIWVTSATTRPSDAPACDLTAESSTGKEALNITYTVSEDDGICGETILYLYRATGNSTYFKNFTVSRESSTTAPEITTDLAATADVTVGVAEDFSIVATGATSYQWYNGENAIEGATSATYSYTATAAGTVNLKCVATNSIGSTSSTVCAVTATAPSSAPTITTDLSAAYNVIKGQTQELSIVAEGASSYQWYVDGEPVEGATSASYTFTAGSTIGATNEVYCAATNAAGTTNSATATMTTVGRADCELTNIKFSNGAYGAINNAIYGDGTIAVPYIAGTSAPTVEETSINISDGATYVLSGNTLTVTAEDETTSKEYTINAVEITPLTVSADVAETSFTEVPSWVFNLYGYDSDKGLKFAKKVDEASNMRIAKGNTRQYYFIGAAKSLTLTKVGSTRKVNVYVNGTKVISDTNNDALGAITLDETAPCMVMIESNQTGGDGGFSAYAIEAVAATTETIEIPAEGVATYVTTNALDFSSVEGLTAYVPTGVNSTKTSVATAEVTSVPAGTALLLKGAEGSYDVDIAESAEAPAANIFQVSDGTVTGADDIFAYSKSALKFKKVASTVTIPSGKCYLVIAGVSGDALDLDFEGEATAIENVDANENANSAAPVKVIKNGKLYIGNYNVAGQQVK